MFKFLITFVMAVMIGSTAIASELTVDQKKEIYNLILSNTYSEMGPFDPNQSIDEMLLSLNDRYSHVEVAKEDNFNSRHFGQKGEYKGYGIEFLYNKNNNVVKIGRVHYGSARKAGIKPKYTITCVNDEPLNITDLESYKKFIDEMRNTDEISFCLTKDDHTYITPVIKKGKVKMEVVRTVIFPSTFYIRIDRFNSTVSHDMFIALRHASKHFPNHNIVIDVRDNPGGVLDQVAKIVDMMISEPGKTIVKTKDKDGQVIDEYITTLLHTIPKTTKVAVLINENSASASEILASALRDLRGAQIVGQNSYGKGSVQTIFENQHRLITITTAHYFTESGIVIDGNGIKPDIEIATNTIVDILDSNINAATDTQLLAAMRILIQ